MKKNDQNDELLKEIWAAREKIENRFGNDIDNIYEYFRSKKKHNPAKYFSGKPVTLHKLKTT